MTRHKILSVLSGSRAYGTNKDNSDYDIREVFVKPLSNLVRVDRTYPQTLTRMFGNVDLVQHEVGKFVKLATSSNPSIVELLASPIIFSTNWGAHLLSLKECFVSSSKTTSSYLGTITGFRESARKELLKHEPSTDKFTKTAIHISRLIHQLEQLHTYGVAGLSVKVPEHMTEDIESRTLTVNDCCDYLYGELTDKIDKVSDTVHSSVSALPKAPDFRAINEFMYDIRKSF